MNDPKPSDLRRNRYWVVRVNSYYPQGGLDDIHGAYDSIEMAVMHFNEPGPRYEHEYVIDTERDIEWAVRRVNDRAYLENLTNA